MFKNLLFSLPIWMPFFDKDDGGGGGSGDTDDADAKAKADADAKAKADAEAKGTGQKSIDDWLAGQPEDIQALYASSVGNLKGALEKERKANKDSAKLLKRLEELEAKEQERIDAQKSEIEKALDAQKKAEAEREAAFSELETERRKYAVIAAATRLGFTDPEDAFTLADLSEIENKDGKWYGIDEALKALSESKPYLLSKNGKTGDGLGNDTKKSIKKEQVKPKAEQARPLVRL